MLSHVNILIINTGGTIGMVKDKLTGTLHPVNADELFRHIPILGELDEQIDIHSFDPLLDSSNISPSHWVEMVRVIEANYEKAESFDTMASRLREDERVAHFRRRGMIWAFDVPDAPAGFARAYAEAALREGVLLRPIGNTVYFMPPYVMDFDEWAMLMRGARQALDATVPHR